MDKELVVFVGGPGSGKSTLIEALREKGFVCYPEISRQVILEAQKQGIEQLFLENPLLFSELLMKGRVEQYQQASSENEKFVFLDRGIPDVLAYLDYTGVSYPNIFVDTCEQCVYDKIFVFEPWRDIYENDNERYESYEQSVLIHDYLERKYQSLGYQLITVPKGNIEERIEFVLNNL